MVKLAVILASGEGSRLSKVAGRYGKPLADLFGFPLIVYPLSSLAAAGVSEFIIVANMYNEELIRRRLAELGFRENTIVVVNRRLGEAGASLIKALEEVGENNFILSMCDHIYTKEHVERLLTCSEMICVAGDKTPMFVEVREATKIKAVNRLAKIFSKTLTTYTYIDTGIFYISKDARDPIFEVAVCPECMSLNDIWNQLISRGYRVGVVDVTGLPWFEVDDEVDYYRSLHGDRRKVVELILAELFD